MSEHISDSDVYRIISDSQGSIHLKHIKTQHESEQYMDLLLTVNPYDVLRLYKNGELVKTYPMYTKNREGKIIPYFITLSKTET